MDVSPVSVPANVAWKKSLLDCSMGRSRLSWVISSQGAPARKSRRSSLPSSTETTWFGIPAVAVSPM